MMGVRTQVSSNPGVLGALSNGIRGYEPWVEPRVAANSRSGGAAGRLEGEAGPDRCSGAPGTGKCINDREAASPDPWLVRRPHLARRAWLLHLNAQFAVGDLEQYVNRLIARAMDDGVCDKLAHHERNIIAPGLRRPPCHKAARFSWSIGIRLDL